MLQVPEWNVWFYKVDQHLCDRGLSGCSLKVPSLRPHSQLFTPSTPSHTESHTTTHTPPSALSLSPCPVAFHPGKKKKNKNSVATETEPGRSFIAVTSACLAQGSANCQWTSRRYWKQSCYFGDRRWHYSAECGRVRRTHSSGGGCYEITFKVTRENLSRHPVSGAISDLARLDTLVCLLVYWFDMTLVNKGLTAVEFTKKIRI